MSDIRTKILLGTSIGSVALILLVSGMGFSTSDTSVSEQGYQILGHVEVMSVDPDGTISYSQGDNAVQDGGKDVAASCLFDAFVACVTFSCIQLGDAGTPAIGTGDTALTQKLTTQTILCDAASPVTTNANAGTPTGAESEIEVQFTILAADAPTTITEVALCTGTTATTVCANMLSHFELAGNGIPVVTDTQVTVTYTMTTG